MSQPESGAMQGIAYLLESHRLVLSQVQSVIHGTTLATNALIQRNGAKTALITAKGFRDVLEMRNDKRFDQYALNIELPEPLVSPRDHRYTLNERTLVDGTVLNAPCNEEIAELTTALQENDIETVATTQRRKAAPVKHNVSDCRPVVPSRSGRAGMLFSRHS